MEINKEQLTENRERRTENKGRLFLTLFFVLCSLFFDNSLSGQDYYLDDNSRFVQRISWAGDEYALYYEVIIEREEGAEYQNVLREFTGEQFIELSLPPGKYRLRVIPYDYRNLPGEAAEWKNFEILAAYMPELFDYSVDSSGKEKNAAYALNLYGKNLVPGAELYLLNSAGNSIVPLETTIHEDGNHARLLFDRKQLVKGVYTIFIRNPGGLEADMEGLIIEDQKKVSIYVSAAWMPVFPLYEGEKPLFNDKPSLLGTGIRLGITPFERKKYINVGLEAASSWYSSYAVINNGEAKIQAVTIDLNLAAQKRFSNDVTVLSFRLGAGYTLFPGSHEPDSLTALNHIHVNLGLSFLWLVTERMYLEAGIDHANFFTSPASGCLRPWLGIGLRF